MNFDFLISQIRADRNLTKEVPAFDPRNGNESAKFLLLLESPGPKAIESGKVSFENPDPSARNLQKQLIEAAITREEIALWNIVPWYIGNQDRTVLRGPNGDDIKEGIKYLVPLIAAMENLRCIVLVGGTARKAHVFLSATTRARIVSCHHTSAKVVNTNPSSVEENIKVFCYIKHTT